MKPSNVVSLYVPYTPLSKLPRSFQKVLADIIQRHTVQNILDWSELIKEVEPVNTQLTISKLPSVSANTMIVNGVDHFYSARGRDGTVLLQQDPVLVAADPASIYYYYDPNELNFNENSTSGEYFVWLTNAVSRCAETSGTFIYSPNPNIYMQRDRDALVREVLSAKNKNLSSILKIT